MYILEKPWENCCSIRVYFFVSLIINERVLIYFAFTYMQNYKISLVDTGQTRFMLYNTLEISKWSGKALDWWNFSNYHFFPNHLSLGSAHKNQYKKFHRFKKWSKNGTSLAMDTQSLTWVHKPFITLFWPLWTLQKRKMCFRWLVELESFSLLQLC